MKHILITVALLGTAAPAFSQALPQQSTALETAPREELVQVAIETSLGRIVLALDKGRAPITTANFLAYVDSHRFDGQTFYRAMKFGDGGLIQGGVRSDARKLLPPIAHEPTSVTGIRNRAGAVAMANAGPGTARSDFFILLSDAPSLDAGGEGGDEHGFAAFGHVVEGMDVARKIFQSPTDPDKGAGVMKGQMLEPEVKILSARRMK